MRCRDENVATPWLKELVKRRNQHNPVPAGFKYANEDLIVSEKPGTTAYGDARPRLCAWLQEHSGHGLGYQVWYFPEGEGPDFGKYIRAPWMDEPRQMSAQEYLEASYDTGRETYNER